MVNCYIIKDKINSMYFTPFFKDKEIGSKQSEEEVTLFCSGSVNEDDRDSARLHCYKEIDNSVELWIQEKRYFPRVLISALTFLVVYFFMSLVIRDPIPMLDEIVGSFIASAAIWYYISKRDKKGPIANKKKLEVKREVSNAQFVELEGLVTLEMYLSEMRSLDIIDVSDRMTLVDEELLDPLTFPEEVSDAFLSELLPLLEKKLFSKSSVLKVYFEKVIECRKEKISNEGLSSRIIQLSREAKLDLPLLALLVAIKEHRLKTSAFISNN